ncbi:MAG: AAA family ATPase [Acidimicrobiales bacterium]
MTPTPNAETSRVSESPVAMLLFTPDRVFKILKPVTTKDFDHRACADRRESLEIELGLGQRLAPETHLGLTPIPEGDDVSDWMLVMRRLDDADRLTSIIRRRELTDIHLRQIAKLMATFHAAQTPVYGNAAGGSVGAHQDSWREILDRLDGFTGSVLDAAGHATIRRLVDNYLAGRGRLFQRRAEDGLIREGHGSLRAHRVFLVDGTPQILGTRTGPPSCRTLDVLDDLASLAIDIHRFAGPIAARSLIRYYCEFSGEHHASSLAHHFVAQHAARRCVEALNEVAAGRLEFAAVARMYHRLILDQLHRGAVRVALVGGGPGSGKSMVAQELALHMGWTLLASDEVRRSIAGGPVTVRPASVDMGRYDPSVTDATYAELLRETALLLEMGESVVLDASWTIGSKRMNARSTAARVGAEILEFECVVDNSTASERVARRLADQWNTSDASAPIVDTMAARRDSWPEAQAVDMREGTLPAMTAVRAAIERTCADPEPDRRVVLPAIRFWDEPVGAPT